MRGLKRQAVWAWSLCVLGMGCGEDGGTDPGDQNPPANYETEDAETIAALMDQVLAAIGPALEGLSQYLEHRGPGVAGSCPTVAVESVRDSVLVSLDYGSGCVTRSGATYAGEITVGGRLTPQAGGELQLAFSGFEVEGGGYAIEGTDALSGRLENLALSLHNTVTSAEQALGLDLALRAEIVFDPQDPTANVYTLTGSGAVEVDQSFTVHFAIDDEDPLVWPASCNYPTQGNVVLTIPAAYVDDLGIPNPRSEDLDAGVDFAAPDFDDPVCDPTIEVSLGSYTEQIEL
ncbi:MAG: hypothetical protein IPK72_20510 [Candidatus Eisenbacteria bacterium]|nr:hypothetical protein [Candidatus Eisenbacteria bacterium]